MPKTNEDIIEDILAREGGSFTNISADRGGPTKWGITQKTLTEELKRDASIEDVKNLTREQAFEIYMQRYLMGPGFNNIAEWDVRSLLVDTAVNNGRVRAIKWFQHILGVKEDGVIGPVTLLRYFGMDRERVFYQYCARRLREYGYLVSRNHSQVIFVSGWINRVCDFIERGYDPWQ